MRLAPSGYGVDRLRQFDPQDVFCPGWQGRRPEVPRPPRQGVGPKGGRSGKPLRASWAKAYALGEAASVGLSPLRGWRGVARIART